MDLQLRDTVVFLTGGGRGIGAAIARTLAAEGARVAVADLDGSRAGDTAAACKGMPLTVDVTDATAVAESLAAVAARWGAVHVVVSNVGITRAGLLATVSDDDVDATLAVNVRGPLNVTRAAVPHLRKAGWGRLIYIGSSSGLKASAGLAVYSASKYFLHGLSVAAGLELGRDGITANIVCPSDVYPGDGSTAGSWLDPELVRISCEKEGVGGLEELKARRIARSPAGRSCSEDDIAALVAFLASPCAGYVNAQAIGVNGGAVPT